MNTEDLPEAEFEDLIRAQEEFLASEMKPAAKVVRRGPASITSKKKLVAAAAPAKKQSKFKSERANTQTGIFKASHIEENSAVPKTVFQDPPSREMGFDIPLGSLGATLLHPPKPSSKPKPAPAPKPTLDTPPNPDDFTISGQNYQKVSTMSSAQIQSAISEINEGISPEFIEMLRKRGAAKSGKKAIPVSKPKPKLPESPPPQKTVVINAPKTDAELASALSALPRSEKEKLEWTTPPPSTTPAPNEPRYNLNGNLLTTPSPSDYPKLYHNPTSTPGYTVSELISLLRSTVPSQRLLATTSLVGVLKTYNLKDPTIPVAARIAVELGTYPSLELISLSAKLYSTTSILVTETDSELSDTEIFTLKPYWTILTRFRLLPIFLKVKKMTRHLIKSISNILIGLIECNKGVARVIVDNGLLRKLCSDVEDFKELIILVQKVDSDINVEDVLESMLKYDDCEECYTPAFRMEGWESVRSFGVVLKGKLKDFEDLGLLEGRLELIFTLSDDQNNDSDQIIDDTIKRIIGANLISPSNSELITTILKNYHGTASNKINEILKTWTVSNNSNVNIELWYQIIKRIPPTLPTLRSLIPHLKPGHEFYASYFFSLPILPKSINEFFLKELSNSKRRIKQLTHSKVLCLNLAINNLLGVVSVMEREDDEELLLPLGKNWLNHLLECSYLNSLPVFSDCLNLLGEGLEEFISVIWVTGEWEIDSILDRLKKGEFKEKDIVEKWYKRDALNSEEYIKEPLYDPEKNKINYNNYKSEHVRSWKNLVDSRVKEFIEGNISNESTRFLLRYIVKPYFPGVVEGLKELKGYYRAVSGGGEIEEVEVKRGEKILPQILEVYKDILTSEFRCTFEDGRYFFVQALAIVVADYVDFKSERGGERLVSVEKVLGEKVGEVVKGVEEGGEVVEVIVGVFS
ncbi:hypothetical protein TL16_g06216 [Triparma laevis f. inornata]|uniref:Uncharacterized protein n=1 Tax=Triparma laevis f. inornata TaxID=1714386 RepID=A0A9W7AR11_9STRA|nr:hypothetical protein TL16_g06216 [Triparma laevis f. inornata]